MVTCGTLTPRKATRTEFEHRRDKTVNMATMIAQCLHLGIASGVSQSDSILRQITPLCPRVRSEIRLVPDAVPDL
ncbi:hypothetical protein AMECASPLE_007911 [Ameca splendens]|uniref:Uncharacterized protein n=1 Tax=Ameca splendens TaxID=208324 RepID=A0ABV0ZVS0_9TELE